MLENKTVEPVVTTVPRGYARHALERGSERGRERWREVERDRETETETEAETETEKQGERETEREDGRTWRDHRAPRVQDCLEHPATVLLHSDCLAAHSDCLAVRSDCLAVRSDCLIWTHSVQVAELAAVSGGDDRFDWLNKQSGCDQTRQTEL